MQKLDYIELVNQLSKIETEQPWLEFKENIVDPEKIGRTISALSNGATLSGHETAYFIWGINDDTHEIVGTTFDIDKAKKGNDDLPNWLRHSLSENTDFEYTTVSYNGKRLMIMSIAKATGNPVMFQNVAYIRDGSYVKPLSKIPILEQKLWKQLQSYNFESSSVTTSITPEKIEDLLDCKSILKLMRYQSPSNTPALMDILEENGIISRQDDGGYCITAHGAILFAKDLTKFDTLSRKTVRIIKYETNSKFNIEKEIELTKGYAAGFEDAEKYLSLLMPSQEIFEGAERRTRYEYPPIAIRELFANAIIHQDLTQTGMNVSIEVFSDRVIVSNPGKMLIDCDKVVNATPVSRNEKIARTMRRIGLCEELGSGWDRVVESCEEYRLPSPMVRCDENSTTVVLSGKRSLNEMSTDDKTWSCYLHTCALYVRGLRMTNSSLRSRFGIEDSNSGSVISSRIIKDTKKKGLIKIFDETAAPKNISYIPYWA